MHTQPYSQLNYVVTKSYLKKLNILGIAMAKLFAVTSYSIQSFNSAICDYVDY